MQGLLKHRAAPTHARARTGGHITPAQMAHGGTAAATADATTTVGCAHTPRSRCSRCCCRRCCSAAAASWHCIRISACITLWQVGHGKRLTRAMSPGLQRKGIRSRQAHGKWE
eukprot:843643-Pelagomonas_calceolata.AAC.8